MDDIDAAFDDAFRTHRIEAGDDPQALPNPYSRPTLNGKVPASNHLGSHETSAGGGGFIVEDPEGSGGGFIVDDSSGGGFIVDDARGGFLVDDDHDSGHGSDGGAGSSSPRAARPSTIPLSSVPEALANLGLDATDASVLALFAETAYVPSSASRRRLAPGVKPEKVVGRQEFQQVAAVLLAERQEERPSSKRPSRRGAERDDPISAEGRGRPTRRAAVKGRQKAARIIDQDDEDVDDDGAAGGGGFIADEADDSEDDFEASRSRRRRRPGGATALDTGSDLTSEGEEAEDDYLSRDASSRRRTRRSAAQRSASVSDEDEDDSDGRSGKRSRRTRKASEPSIRSTTHLNPLQRENAAALYELLLERLPASTLATDQRRIGPDGLAQIIAAIGEKIPAKEVEEMIEEGAKLFAPASAHHDDARDGNAVRKSAQAIKGAATAQGISGSSIGLDEFAGILVHNRLL